MKWVALGLAVYAGVGIVTFGAMNATDQWKCHHRWATICDARMVRQDKFKAAVSALFPPGWIAALFLTYGYADGVSFSAEPHMMMSGVKP